MGVSLDTCRRAGDTGGQWGQAGTPTGSRSSLASPRNRQPQPWGGERRAGPAVQSCSPQAASASPALWGFMSPPAWSPQVAELHQLRGEARLLQGTRRRKQGAGRVGPVGACAQVSRALSPQRKSFPGHPRLWPPLPWSLSSPRNLTSQTPS